MPTPHENPYLHKGKKGLLFLLNGLLKDKEFMERLAECCRKDGQNMTVVGKCIDGLYHHASKHVHGRLQYPIRLHWSDWEWAERTVLVAIFIFCYEYLKLNLSL